ncbi:unnamed protein product [Peronospora farinosa]|uniref:Uncharacterized protein n=1 Tax=Peronospora farinosa TaxID=134698 RepID=A0AAV0TF48_9STRA|nr:unnamed protein product [Peronospora farinosa]CAI5720873.1 unnamed protein product [Peronospora farinosa]
MIRFSRFFAAIVVAVGAVFHGNGGGVAATIISPVESTPMSSHESFVETTQVSLNESPVATSPTPTDKSTSTNKPTPTGKSTGSFTVENTCVLTDFHTATDDFVALNNLINIVKTTPTLLKPYVSDPLIIKNYTMSTFNISFLGHIFETTPTIDTLNVTGITTIAPMPVNVTSSSTLLLGTTFNGTVTVRGTFTVDVAQLNHKWYQLCWINLLHPIKCRPKRFNVAVAFTVRKPKFVLHMKAVMYQCASGIPTSACQNLTIPTIMSLGAGGNFTGLSSVILKNFKEAKIYTLALGWDLISEFHIDFYKSNRFFRAMTNTFLNPPVDNLNRKGYYHRVFLDVAQSFLLSLMNKIIDTILKPLFGATCL